MRMRVHSHFFFTKGLLFDINKGNIQIWEWGILFSKTTFKNIINCGKILLPCPYDFMGGQF